MTYIPSQAQRELLETVAEAIDELSVALAALGAAYEQLDEQSADRLPGPLVRPVLAGRSFAQAAAGLPSQGVKGFLERADAAVGEADAILADLQDSMRPVEV